MLTTPQPAPPVITGLSRLTAALTAHGSSTSDGSNWTCPAHPDRSPSLSIGERDGRAVFNCHAGCSGAAVLDALALTSADLSDAPDVPVPGPPPAWAQQGHGVAQYPYYDAAGALLFTVHRRVGKDGRKDFRQQAADGSWSVRGIEPVLYNLPQVLATAAAKGAVDICEGEKDALALHLSGAVSTCNPGGAKKWRDQLADALAGCSMVTVWRDRDWLKTGEPDSPTPGDAWARAVVDSLARRGIPFRVVEAQAGKDAWDHLAAGYTREQAAAVTLQGSGDPGLEGMEVVPAKTSPMPVARHLEKGWRDPSGHLLRYHWRGAWMVWTGAHWREETDGEFRAALYLRLEHSVYEKAAKDGPPVLMPWNPDPGSVAALEAAARAVCHLPPDTDEGSVLGPDGWTRPAGSRVAFSNGVLDVATRAFTPPSPAYFNTSSVPFAYDPAASAPAAWLAFLDQLWGSDPEAVALVQEWFGYVLSGRTDLQKILFLQGPPRSGKGTIARILRKIVGEANYAGPTLAGLTETFGLQSLIGKSLAVISDMRMPERGQQLVLERLLSISGEDALDVNRKFKPVWTGRLPVRLMVVSNNLPGFKDPSNAFTNRLVLARLSTSFLGREDPSLEARLTAELDGILLWALDGLERLEARGWFVPPASGRNALEAVAGSSSPLSGFLDEHCVQGPGQRVVCADLFAAYTRWGREENGQHWTPTNSVFGRELAELADVRKARVRVGGKNTWVYEGIGLVQKPEASVPHALPGGAANPFARAAVTPLRPYPEGGTPFVTPP